MDEGGISTIIYNSTQQFAYLSIIPPPPVGGVGEGVARKGAPSRM